MANFHLSLDLSPLPSPEPSKLRFGLQVCGAAKGEPDASARIDALRAALDAITGDMPQTYVDEQGKKPWTDIEAAFKTHFGECLPWMWTSISLKLVVGSTYLPSPPAVISPVNPSLGTDSIDCARRGFILAIYRGSKELVATGRFRREGLELSGVAFSFFIYSVQATRWPAPMPQEVFKSVMVLEIDRALLNTAADDDGIAAVMGFMVDGRDYSLPASAPALGPVPYTATWPTTSGMDTIQFETAGLRCKDVLDPPKTETSFLHPGRSLWLEAAPGAGPDYDDMECGPGCAIGDHDWWSRLHDGVSSAAETARVLIEAVRGEPAADHLRQHFGETVTTLICVLRDLLAPGILHATALGGPQAEPMMFPSPRPPVMLDLLAGLRAADNTRVSSLDLLAIVVDTEVAGWLDFAAPPAHIPAKDLEELALVYCVLWHEFHSPCTPESWYATFRKLSRILGERLPDDELPSPSELQKRFEHLTHSGRLDLLDTLRTEATSPALRSAGLYQSWIAATEPGQTDPPKLKAAKVLAQAFLGTLEEGRRIGSFLARQDVARLFVATAGVDVVRLATRSQPGDDPKEPFAAKIARAISAHVDIRLTGGGLQHPRVKASGSYPGMSEAVDLLAREAHTWIFRREGVPSTGQPGPLVLQLDSLHDDSALQAGETDLNQWLNGYAAFYRRAAPVEGISDWGCGQIGVIEARMWPDRPVMLDPSGNPLPALLAEAAATSYGVRQVLLMHDNRPMLPAWGTEVISDPQQKVTGWTGADGFAVVEPETDLGLSMAQPPHLAFGLDYEAVAFAQGRTGVHPHELAGKYGTSAPYLLDPTIDVKAILGALPSIRELKYRRLTTVSAPRVVARVPKAPSGRLPRDWVPTSVSKQLDLAHVGWPMSETAPDDGREVCVLVSGAGLKALESLPTHWQSQLFDLKLPTCTSALYDRWIGYECATVPIADKPKWMDWRAQIQASELVINAWQGDVKADDATKAARMTRLKNERAQLDDPAVSAFILTWTPLRSDGTSSPPFVLPLPAAARPPVPTHDTTDEEVLFERDKAAPENWTLRVAVFEGTTRPKRFVPDTVTSTITVWLWPGEIGDLAVASGMALSELHRCGFEAETVVENYMVFEPWRARFEVATAHFPEAETLFDHCLTSMSPVRDLSLQWWRAPAPEADRLKPEQLALDNVGELAPRRQVWHGTGRPLPSFPSAARWLDDMFPLQALFDGSPDPSSSAVLWDGIGFAERFDELAVWTEVKKPGIRNQRDVLHADPAGGDPSPRYVRYAVEARHRYAPLYGGLLTLVENRSAVEPRTALQRSSFIPRGSTERAIDQWVRAFRPGAGVHVVQRPAVRMVVPLTRTTTADGKASGADLMVVLNEELSTPEALTNVLEATVTPVSRVWNADTGDQTTLLEQGPDPILTKSSQSGTWVGVPCLGPLGHTFDTDSREPRFVGTSFVVQTGGLMEAWGFAKLSFRRLLLPELLDGYFPQVAAAGGKDRITPVGTSGPLVITGAQLEQHWQAHLTLAGLAQPKPTCRFDIEALGKSLSLELRCVEADKTRKWSIRMLAKVDDAFIDQDWSAVQRFASSPQPNDRLAKPDFRIIAARIREAYDDGVRIVPARWEIAGYVAVSQRPEKDGALGFVSWDRRWVRVLIWRLDEPADIAATHVSLAASSPADHGIAQALPRVSEYTPSEWVQTLPSTASLSIAGKAWVDRQTQKALALKVIDPKTLKLRILEGDAPARLQWGRKPVAAGEEGQGLHHVLLVTRRAQTADGLPSEAYLGLFNLDAGGDFLPLEKINWEIKELVGSDLRGYVLLVQKSPRIHSGDLGFWESIFPDESSDPRSTRDARLRILAVGEPIDGIR